MPARAEEDSGQSLPEAGGLPRNGYSFESCFASRFFTYGTPLVGCFDPKERERCKVQEDDAGKDVN